jgi:hypothetical protein
LYTWSLHWLGCVRQAVTVHCQSHNLAGHVLRREERSYGRYLVQRIQQARAIANVLHACRASLSLPGFINIAGTTQVMPVQPASAERYRFPTAAPEADLVWAVSQRFFDHFSGEQHSIAARFGSRLHEEFPSALVGQTYPGFLKYPQRCLADRLDFLVT